MTEQSDHKLLESLPSNKKYQTLHLPFDHVHDTFGYRRISNFKTILLFNNTTNVVQISQKFTLYQIVKRSVAKCVSDRATVHNGNASNFAPEQTGKFEATATGSRCNPDRTGEV